MSCVYLILVTVFRSLRLESSALFREMQVDGQTTLFVSDSVSYLYGAHQALLLSIAFLCISLTSQRLGAERKEYDKLFKTQVDRLY